MSIARLISVLMESSMFLMVLVLGLKTTVHDVTFLLRNRGQLIRALLSMNVIMLAFAIAAALTFKIDQAIEVALISLAASPVPPLLPGKQMGAGGSASYAMGLLVVAALFAIILTPLGIEVATHVVARDMHISLFAVTSVVAVSVFAPLAIGVIVAKTLPQVATLVARPLSVVATLLLLAAFLPIAIFAWPAFARLVGNGVILFLFLFTTVGLAVGHMLGGPAPRDRTVLALATGSRHPGVALAITSLNFPGDKTIEALIIYHLIVSAIVSWPYISWRRRLHARAE
jgi:bile acid:Na+ symporter, BASS family